MIIGGIGGICKVGAGGSRIGYRETFAPCIAFGAKDLAEETAVEYTARAQITNASQEAIDISDTDYYQVTTNDQAVSTANITVRNLEKWSPLGDVYPGLLVPSGLNVKLYLTVKTATQQLATTLFTGQVTNYTESVGSRSEAITLVCRGALKNNLPEGAATLSAEPKTRFRILERELARFGINGPISIFIDDSTLEAPLTYSRISEIVRAFFGWTARTTAAGSGLIIEDRALTGGPVTLTLNDDTEIQRTRTVGEDRYNAIKTAALQGGTWVFDEVFDSTDVGIRGKIYAPRRLSSESETIEQVNARAAQTIAEQMTGQISTSTRLNPLAAVRSLALVSSVRQKISSATGVISQSTHRYRHGEATTNLTVRLQQIS